MQSVRSEMMECKVLTTKKSNKIISTISNVSKLPLGTKAVGPDFYLTPQCRCNVSFEKNSSWLFLYIFNKSDSKIKIGRTIVLFDCNNQKLHEERKELIFFIEKQQSVDVIGRVSNTGIFDTLINDTLIIELCVNMKKIRTKKMTNRFICDIDPGQKLREDLMAMLKNPVNSDVSLQVGDKKIPAHWSILCSRSSYFKKIFDSKIRERVQNSIIITDLSLSTLENLLEFLYTADFDEEVNLQVLFDLYYAADKYVVTDLRNVCANKIMNISTPDNICQILQLAHYYNDKKLKTQVMGFIQEQADDVFQTDGWKNFEASEPFVAEVFSFFCLKEN